MNFAILEVKYCTHEHQTVKHTGQCRYKKSPIQKNECYFAIFEEIKNNKIYEEAFEWRFEFPEVLDDNGDFVGFDAIIGNPPYVAVSGIPKDQREYIFSFYKNASSRIDLFGLFTRIWVISTIVKGFTNIYNTNAITEKFSFCKNSRKPNY